MHNNIFMEDQKQLSFEQYLQYDEKSRSNLGETLPVLVYRMLEYSMKDELVSRLGKDAQIDIFRKAGQRSGEYFARNMLHLDQPLNQFISELQAKLQELKIGVLRIESGDEETGRIILTVSEDADCSGLPVLGETVCNYDEGFLSGILSGAMVNNTIAIIVTCPIAKEIGSKYKIAPKRLASLVDIFACAFISLMPHDGGMLMITALADVSPLNVLKYSFYMFGLIIATCVTIQFGLMDEKN